MSQATYQHRRKANIKDAEMRLAFDEMVKAFNTFVAAVSPTTGGPVVSVFGRGGAVVAAAADYASFYVPVARTITAGTGLTGGGALSANRTLAVTGNLATLYALSHAAGFLKNNGAGVLSWSALSTSDVSGLGTMAAQNANAVNITGGSLSGLTGLTMASGQILTAAGSAAAPAIGVGATDYGFYFSTNRIDVSIAGTQRYSFNAGGLVFRNSGNYAILDASANEFLKFTSVASAVTYVNITNGATGNPAKIEAAGETNVDLLLGGAGTGVLRFGTHTAIGAETLTGYITIKDAAGNTRKLAVVS